MTNPFYPPFVIWLYGWHKQRSRTQAVSPADAWRAWEAMEKALPLPNGRIEKLLYSLACARIRKAAAQWHALDNVGVLLVGSSRVK